MSGSHRRDRGALVALGLSLTAIVLVAWFSQPPNAEIVHPSASATEISLENHSGWWPQFEPSDTYAQWLVALLTVVATAISAWAVWLVRDSLRLNREAVEAARDAVDETRRIGQAQVRAYLNISAGKYEAYTKMIRLHFDVSNTGSSPASDILMTVQIWTEILKGDTPRSLKSDIITYQAAPFRVENITASGSKLASTFIEPETDPSEDFYRLYAAMANGAWFKLKCHLSWRDVFGDEQAENFRLVSDYPPQLLTDATMGTFYKGNLIHDRRDHPSSAKSST